MKNLGLFWFIKSSIGLDFNFCRISDWSFGQKLEFLFKKYLEIFLLLFKLHRFKLGESFIVLFKKKYFYDSPYGIAGYQSMLTRPQKMINYAGIDQVRTVIDIGANVGFFSLMIRNKFPKAKIYAIEPVPKIFKCLERNLTDKLDKTFNIAISEKKGFLEMSFDELWSSLSHVLISKKDQRENKGLSLRVTGKTLDQFCQENKIDLIDILKIDTEGFEDSVLRGAKVSLSRTRYLHLEISTGENDNYTFSQINSLLYSNKYNFQLIYFRNYTDKGEGPITVGDFLFKNTQL